MATPLRFIPQFVDTVVIGMSESNPPGFEMESYDEKSAALYNELSSNFMPGWSTDSYSESTEDSRGRDDEWWWESYTNDYCSGFWVWDYERRYRENECYVYYGFPLPTEPSTSSPTSQDSSPASAPPRLGFFDLPLEIRRQIYSDVLGDMEIDYNKVSIFQPSRSPVLSDFRNPLPLLLLSKRVSCEAAELLYRSWKFCLNEDAGVFLNSIGDSNLGFLSFVEIIWDSQGGVGQAKWIWLAKKLAELPRLRRAVINVSGHMKDYVVCLGHIAHRVGLDTQLRCHFLEWHNYEFQAEVTDVTRMIDEHDTTQGVRHLTECGGSCGLPTAGESSDEPVLECIASRSTLDFLKFPLSVRNMTYWRLLAPGDVIPVSDSYGSLRANLFRLGHNPEVNILSVNRQIYSEASIVLYGASMISLRELDPNLFLNQIGPANERQIRSLELKYDFGYQITGYLHPLRLALPRLALNPDIQVRLFINYKAVPHLHRLKPTLQLLRDAIHEGLRVIAEDPEHDVTQDVSWVIDMDKPWGWDHKTQNWRPFSEILTWELVKATMVGWDVENLAGE
ncbi:hypothetical protein FGG08_001126 [Glutinoglossum americanum]|uniref:Uncharacterized protein n=1 Tax=Glutinoglossum americanum TaxID=1670608 RepID=A0A9P8I7I5_9PEZI|nr:hypothetical protein FGG08_001126 [Glutinoglossum americanum]